MKRSVVVTQDEENPVAQEVLADVIVKISDGMTKLLASGLNRKAIIVLLHDSTDQPKYRIEAVLDGLDSLRAAYTRR